MLTRRSVAHRLDVNVRPTGHSAPSVIGDVAQFVDLIDFIHRVDLDARRIGSTVTRHGHDSTVCFICFYFICP
jgi:hypothetical protein